MKNALNYYYGLNVEIIHQKEKNYYFRVNDFSYLLLQYDNIDEISDIYKLNIFLKQFIPVHEIILNNKNSIFTNISDDNYILLRMSAPKFNIGINDIINLNNINIPIDDNKLRRDDWYNMWIQKVDYFEYQVSQIGKKYPVIRESFNYYVGLAENAIILIKNTNKNVLKLGLSHRRIDKTSFELYNPLNMILDIRIRDICEYFKYCFFNNIDIDNELDLFLTYNKLSHDEGRYFMARMLFPTYYFDLYEKIINDEIDEKELNRVILKANKYEKVLQHIYLYFKSNDLNIEWLESTNLY